MFVCSLRKQGSSHHIEPIACLPMIFLRGGNDGKPVGVRGNPPPLAYERGNSAL
jgi:hypothetical protein